MKPKTVIVLLVFCCLGLSGALIWRHHTAMTQRKTDDGRIRHLSNVWNEAETKLNEQLDVNNDLMTKLRQRTSDLDKTQGQLATTRSTLSATETEAKATKVQLAAAQVEVTNKQAVIGELKQQNSILDRQTTEMRAAITEREARIVDTEKRLAASEGDREFLLKELRRLQTEKADLERRFADLVVLRDQMKKLKEELALTRRLK